MQNITLTNYRQYHYEEVNYDDLGEIIKRNFPLVKLKSKEQISFCDTILNVMTDLLNEHDRNHVAFLVLGGYFFEYLEQFNIQNFYQEFCANQDIDIFVDMQNQEEIKARNPSIFGNATHNYFFHDRYGFQHEVFTKKIPISISGQPHNVSIKFSPTANSAYIFDHFDLEPCKIAYTRNKFFISRFFVNPLSFTSVNGLNVFGNASITRILKLLMKGFLHPRNIILPQTPAQTN